MTPIDELKRVELSGTGVEPRRPLAEGRLETQPDPPRPFAHVLSQPLAYNGESFVKCACGLTFGDLHGVLPTSCPAEADDAVLALAVEQWKDARVRQRLVYHADAMRLRRAMASESRA